MNNFIIFFIFLFLTSCKYPDIDTVPSFDSVVITKEDTIQICKFNNKFKESKLEINRNYKEDFVLDYNVGSKYYTRILIKTSFNLIGKEDCFREIRYLIERL